MLRKLLIFVPLNIKWVGDFFFTEIKSFVNEEFPTFLFLVCHGYNDYFTVVKYGWHLFT